MSLHFHQPSLVTLGSGQRRQPKVKLHASCMLKWNVSLHTNTFGIMQKRSGFNAIILDSTSLSPRHVSKMDGWLWSRVPIILRNSSKLRLVNKILNKAWFLNACSAWIILISILSKTFPVSWSLGNFASLIQTPFEGWWLGLKNHVFWFQVLCECDQIFLILCGMWKALSPDSH